MLVCEIDYFFNVFYQMLNMFELSKEYPVISLTGIHVLAILINWSEIAVTASSILGRSAVYIHPVDS